MNSDSHRYAGALMRLMWYKDPMQYNVNTHFISQEPTDIQHVEYNVFFEVPLK